MSGDKTEEVSSRQHVVANVSTAALICVCFLLGSSGWLSWLYRITEFADPAVVDVFTMVLGYLVQAVGIAVFIAVGARMEERARTRLALGSIVGYAVLIIPAVLGGSLVSILTFGYLANVLCGAFQGYYLMRLASSVQANRRGTVFGCGYAVSTLATWLLSLVGDGALSTGGASLAVCAVLALLSAASIVWEAKEGARGFTRQPASGNRSGAVADSGQGQAGRDAGFGKSSKVHPKMTSEAVSETRPNMIVGAASEDRFESSADREEHAGGAQESRQLGGVLIALVCATILMASLVKNTGFAFPTADLEGVNLEFSRLFYGVGLVIAGIAADRSRRLGMALCAASLAVPFLTLALSGAAAPAVVLWALEYLLYGFFVIFRVTLAADLAARRGAPWFAGAGMLFGRVGDALGTALCTALAFAPLILIAITAVLFAVSVALMFALGHRLYEPATPSTPARDERELLREFAVAYELSAREREVLPLLLDGKTNAEIAASLFITESTVKFHVRNILKKTECTNRLDVVALYAKRTHSA